MRPSGAPVEIFAAIRERFPKLECDIIGQGPERARLESLTRELKISHRVRFHGKRTRTEVAAAMAQCTLFALPSRYEGLGCVYLEAMATAKPVIGCAGQGIEEVIAHGRNGWLIQPDSLPEMTDALADLLSNADRRYRIGQEARRTVLAGFTLAHQADMLLRVDQGCMA